MAGNSRNLYATAKNITKVINFHEGVEWLQVFNLTAAN